MQKTYFPIASSYYGSIQKGDKLEVILPPYFRDSQNEQKYIVVRNCKIIVDDALVSDVKFHSDIVKENPYDDYFICFTNELMVKPKKYRWKNSSNTIKIWFTNMRNEPLGVVDFSIDILLIY
jgi:hypothetical protein